MDQFNKALSFILGLVVVAVFIVFASGKIKLGSLKLPKMNTTAKISTTPSPKPTAKPISTMKVNSNGTVVSTTKGSINTTTPVPTYNYSYHSYSGKGVPASIPNTGVPIVLFPLLGSGMATGFFLRSKGKKE